MKFPSFLSPKKWKAWLEECRWRIMTVSALFWDDPRRMFYCGVFPALHLITLGLLIFLAIYFEDNKGIYFTRVACLHRLAYKKVCIRYDVGGWCDEMAKLHEFIWLREKYLLSYVYDQVESIFPEKSHIGDNLKHTDLVGNLTIRQYRVNPRPVDSVLPGASASPEWSEDLQDLTPPDPNLFPFPNYIHTQRFRSHTDTYGYTPHAYVLMGSTEARNKTIPDIRNLTLGRVKALQDANWVDANSRVVVMQSAFHKQDDNVFVHLSIVYEKKGDNWKFSTKFLGARLSTYFFYPDEDAIQEFTLTEKKLFVSSSSYLISTVLPTVLLITLFELVFETPHLWRLQFFKDGFRVFLLNVIMAVMQIITIIWSYQSAIHLKKEVDHHYGNFYDMDVYQLLHTATWLTRTIIVQIWIHMLKMVYMPAYFHPVIDDLLRRLRTVIPVLCRMMFFFIVIVLLFGALLVSREGWGSLIPTTLEVFATIINDPEHAQYHFLYFPLVFLFLFMLVPLMISLIVGGADNPRVTQEEVVTGPITPEQLRQRQLRLEVRRMLESLLDHTSKGV